MTYGQQLQINITDRNGLTALGCACLFGHLDCVDLIIRCYPESLTFSYRYHDFESVPESVVRNMMVLSPEDRQETLHCLAHLITRGSPLTEKLIRRVVGRKYENELVALQEVEPCLTKWNLDTLGYPDVVVFVTGSEEQCCEILCHSFILETHSETFKTMFESSLTTQINEKFVLRFPQISERVFRLILLWMYSGEDITADPGINFSWDVLIELMIASNEFFIFRLQRICEHRISQCIQKQVLTDESINQIKALAVMLHLDHLLVFLTHETSGKMGPLTSICHLQNQCPDRKDLNFPLEPRMLKYLCFQEATHQQISCFEIDFLRQILVLRFGAMCLETDTLRIAYERLCQVCLEKVSELGAFSLETFLLRMYSISNSTLVPLEDSKVWNDLLSHSLSTNRAHISQFASVPILCKLVWICFSSLFDFCLFSWE